MDEIPTMGAPAEDGAAEVNVVEQIFPHAEYHTDLGALLRGKFEDIIVQSAYADLQGRVNLIFTSPPFALNNKKRYDNKQGEAYKQWLASYAGLFRDLLTDDGSLVIELGNAWEPGLPVMSTLALEALLELKRQGNFYLCQQFVVNNPARLPAPAEWVTVRRVRVTDSFTHVWWLSNTPSPKADNRRVLRPYSESMRRLLKRGTYNAGARPSGYVISEQSFLTDHGGAIPHNVLKPEPDASAVESLLEFAEQCPEEVRDILARIYGLSNFSEFSNTSSSDPYIRYCKQRGIPLHPARMHIGVPSFFIAFLTDPGDIVLDPFAGSNTTGAVAEQMQRRWLAFEPMDDYIRGSRGRFPSLG